MPKWLSAADTARANAAFSWLHAYLETSPFDAADGLAAAIRDHGSGLATLLKDRPPLCKGIEELRARVDVATLHGVDIRDIRLVHSALSMLYVLMVGYELQGHTDECSSAIRDAHDSVVRQYLRLASGQVDALCHFLREICDYVASLNRGNARVIVLEMPVGNSLPSKLLASTLRQHAPVELLRVSLSRNPSKKAGVTRRELLETKLRDAQLRDNDLVIYVDEWNTGSNYAAICEILKKVMPKNSFLFPAALLTDRAPTHDRFDSFCLDHDLLLGRWEVPGKRYRRPLPQLPSALGGEYFFWSEQDRLAGYRKTQLHGSMFSSIDDAVEVLRRDSDALQATATILDDQLGLEQTGEGRSTGANAIRALFDDAYEDYHACRDELRAAADSTARGDEIGDFDDAMAPLLAQYEQVLDDRRAKLAVCLAATYIRRLGSLDPANRYYFKEHAPILAALDGVAARMHEVAMEALQLKVDKIGEVVT